MINTALKAGSTRYLMSFPPGLQAAAENAAKADRRSLNNWLLGLVETEIARLKSREVAIVEKLTPAQAWEGFMGEQTPAEFLRIVRERDGAQDIDAICTAYAQELPSMFDGWDHSQDLEAIADLLAQYIRSDLVR